MPCELREFQIITRKQKAEPFKDAVLVFYVAINIFKVNLIETQFVSLNICHGRQKRCLAVSPVILVSDRKVEIPPKILPMSNVFIVLRVYGLEHVSPLVECLSVMYDDDSKDYRATKDSTRVVIG